MIDIYNLPPDLLNILRDRFGDKFNEIKIPPTSFVTMEGQIVEYDLSKGYLKTKFPVLKSLLNQFGNMQGGMLAAAVDNTLGPLSMLVAPPNFTRNLEIIFRKPVHPDIGHIYVVSHLVERKRRQINFIATVIDDNNTELATAKASHWVIGTTNSS